MAWSLLNNSGSWPWRALRNERCKARPNIPVDTSPSSVAVHLAHMNVPVCTDPHMSSLMGDSTEWLVQNCYLTVVWQVANHNSDMVHTYAAFHWARKLVFTSFPVGNIVPLKVGSRISKWETRNSASTPTSDSEIRVSEPNGTQH